MAKYLLTLLAILSFSIGSSWAQIQYEPIDSLSQSIKNLVKVGETSIFTDARTPRFNMVNNDKKFLFGVGGYFMGRGYYDFTGSNAYGLYPDDVAVPFNSNIPDKIGFSVNSSRLIFKLLGETKLGILESTFEASFGGGEGVFKLSRAYVRFGGFSIGYNWSVVTDWTTAPNILDDGGPAGAFGGKTPQIRYAFDPTQNLRLYLSLEFPILFFNSGETLYSVNEFLPDFDTKIRYTSPNQNYTGQFATILRCISPDASAITDNKPVRYFGYGATTSHSLNVGKSTLYASGSIGRGVSDHFEGGSSSYLNITEINITDGVLNDFKPVWMWGAVGAYSLKWSDRASSTAALSYMKVLDWGNIAERLTYDADIDELYSASVNFLITPIEFMDAGIELLYGKKTLYTKESGHGLRIGLIFKYSF